MMINQPNTLVTTEWLYPLLKEELVSLHGKLRYASEKDKLLLLSKEYHQLSSILKVANLSYFSELAQAIESIVTAVADNQLPSTYVHKSLYASELLLHELTNYVQTGDYHQQLIANRQNYLYQILLSHNVLDAVEPIEVNNKEGDTPVDNSSDEEGFTIDFSSTKRAVADSDNSANRNHEFNNSGISLSCVTEYIEPPNDYEGYALSIDKRSTLLTAWRANVRALLEVNSNEVQFLNQLKQVAYYMQGDAYTNQTTAHINLWHLTVAWLKCLTLNQTPTPTVYAYLLSKLDSVISKQTINKSLASNINSIVNDSLVDVYIQLRSLEKTTEDVRILLDKIDNRVNEDSDFFPRLLSQLEHIIFQVNSPKDIITPLKSLGAQLHNRGWQRFQQQIDQITHDLEMSIESEDVFAQMQWAIERQLQDLYASILSAHQTIDTEIGAQQSTYSSATDTQNQIAFNDSVTEDTDTELFSSQTIRRARIAIEDIKHAFNSFLQEQNSDLLDKKEEFSTLQSAFEEMGLTDVASVTQRSAQIFKSIVARELDYITWALTEAIAEELASLELFMDYLAQQTLDNALFEQVKRRLIQAEKHLDDLIDSPDIIKKSVADLKHHSSPPALNVTRYDDSGELTPPAWVNGNADSVENETTESNEDSIYNIHTDEDNKKAQTSETTQISDVQKVDIDSEELLAARATLKNDSFDMDEEIREIFIEEAEEVIELLDVYLPKWRAAPEDLTPLSEIRRGFHTLKGSGRMVGAHNAGEMAWAVENLLNRVLDGSLVVNDELIGFITETKDLIPVLVDDFARQQVPSIDPAITVLKAHNLQKGRPIDFGLGSIYSKRAIDSEKAIKSDDIPQIVTKDSDLPEVLVPFIADVDIPSDANDADPDIKEIFIEEAQEVLEEIIPKYRKWQDNSDNIELLTDVRRGFHTLKGSGRMVGANSTAELAWSIENMLNRVLDKSIEVDSGIQALVEDVVRAYPEMIKAYEQGKSEYPEEMPLWIACANAYTKDLGGDFNYNTIVTMRQKSRKAKNGALDNNNSDKLLESERRQSSEVISDSNNAVLNNMTMANLKLQHATDTANTVPKDKGINDFEQVFLDEASELISKIERFIEDNKGANTVTIDDDMVRAFHTLRGAAGSRSLQAISDVSSTVESSLENLQQHDEPMTANHLQAIAQSVSLIKQYVKDFQSMENTTVSQQDVDSLQNMFVQSQTKSNIDTVSFRVSDIIDDDINDLLDAEWTLEAQLPQQKEQVKLYAEVLAAQLDKLLSRVSSSKKFVAIVKALKAVYLKIQEYPENAEHKNVSEALLAGHQQLTHLLDALAGSMTLKLDHQVIEDLHAIASPKAFHEELIDHVPLGEGAVSQNIEFEEVDTDEELLEIFLEEAQEIDADITDSFGLWKKNPQDLSALKVLQRHLHTIKGGARMAGIVSIGDLTHEAETIYECFVEHKIEPTMTWVSVMQGVQDTLSQQIDYMVKNGRSFYATHLVKQLHDLVDKRSIPDNYRLELPNITVPKEAEDAAKSLPSAVYASTLETNTNIIESEFETFKRDSWNGYEPDTDILEVFLEEAEELVDSSAINMQAFRTNTSNIAALQELQRELHTLKGGARMVGANGIADIAHHMETVYEDLASRRRPATKMISQLLAICHDWIAEAIYILEHSVNPPKPVALIKELQNFSTSPDKLQSLPQVSLREYIDIVDKYETWSNTKSGNHDISDMPPLSINTSASEDNTSLSNEMIRVSSGLMEQMINLSGESNINRARIDMSVTSLNNTIDEMGMTVQRLADQLRRMDIELEAQVLSQIDEETKLDESFDPLEMDQYSSLNQLSKSLSESASDLLEIKTTMLDKTRDAEDLLLQLSRTQTELQNGLMNSRMVPFSRLTPRLQRIVRQTANEVRKSVDLTIINADDEIDRTILERITSPLEHMLRNAVDHGVETKEERESKGKDPTGHILLEITREGSEIVIKLTDDGRGINVSAVRNKAISQGLIDANDDSLTDLDVMQYIFNAGLTTTNKVTQISGRGVGMDVVLSEIRQLGGTVSVDSQPDKGSTFAMRVPLTVAISDALVVRVADRYYAIPLIQIERVERVNPEALFEYYQSDSNTFEIEDTKYRLRYLNEMLTGVTLNELAVNMNVSLPVIIVKNQTDQNLAIQVDEVAGSRIEVVVKPLGRQLSQIAGLSAATIMGDGSVMLILDILALIRNAPARSVHKAQLQQPKEISQARTKILVVDDSVTVRKVTTRLLERQGYDTYVARDGVEALEILQELKPDLMLLDIEMPRMDGFDVAQNVRHDSRLKDLPIIMITSRTGDKHRERAMEIGVNDYMGKPFQESQLMSRIQSVIGVTTGDNYD